jgi:hypothetical protein
MVNSIGSNTLPWGIPLVTSVQSEWLPFDWTEKIDNYNSIDTIYLDFQKAFDTVPHIRLLSKLEGYIITGKILGWIKNF